MFIPATQRKLSLSIKFVLATLPCLPILAHAQNDTQTVEEVLVTGSYIRRSEGFTAASQVTQFSAEDLEAEGTINMGEVVQNLTFVNGAESAITNSVQGTSSNVTSVNLRGLGASSTLTLMDGKRVPTENVLVMLPNIAIQRLDIVADGASALYGSEAVAGVVNFVPFKNYEGLKLEAYTEGDSRGDFRDSQLSLLWGGTISDDIDVVFAASHRDNTELAWHERPLLLQSGLTFSGTANPGNFNVPLRDENGALIGASERRPDPNCGERTDPGVAPASPFGFELFGRCWFEVASQRDFREPSEISTYYGSFTWRSSEDLTLSAQFNYGRQYETGSSSTSNPGGRVSELPMIRGELPGNPFRATDANGNPLFAVDANGDTLPDRDSSGAVILTADPTNPGSGIPFNEDVTFNAWRPLGNANTLSSGHNPDGSQADENDDRNWRVALQADFTVPFVEGWRGSIFYTAMEFQDTDRSTQSLSFSAIEQGLNCDVLNDRDACFNPFAVVDPADATSVHVMDAIATRFREENTTELQTWDAIFTGIVPGISLPGGEVGAAVGYQRRHDTFSNIPAANIIAGDQFIGDQLLPFAAERHVDSFFLELALPVLDNLEVEAAIRNEDFSTGQESTDPKIGVVWSPVDWLNLRSTWGEAFVAPTIRQLNDPQICGLSNADDPFSSFSGFVTTCNQGNPDLVPESSETLTFGFDLMPIDGLRVSLTYNETDFANRIVGTNTVQLLRTDYFNFQQATGFAGDPNDETNNPSIEQLTSWVSNPLSDQRIVRDPQDITRITTVFASDSNAASVLVEAFDLQADYSFDIGNLGNFRINLQGTFVDRFQFQESVDRPIEQAVGRQNSETAIAPALPEWKANLRLGWNRGNHAASVVVRYVDEVIFDANEFSFQQFAPFSEWQSTDVIRSWVDADAFYTYRGIEWLGGESAITIGARNITDRWAQRTGMTTGVVGELQDPLGRVVYARVNYEF